LLDGVVLAAALGGRGKHRQGEANREVVAAEKKWRPAAKILERPAPVLGYIVGKNGVRPDPEKIRVIKDWPVPVDAKGLRKFLGLAAYLHKYSRNYVELTVPLSRLLKKDVKWTWDAG
jgi:hypothetical protein